MNMKLVLAGVTAATMIATNFIAIANAQTPTPTRIEQFNAWGAYTHQTQTGKVCYILSIPTKKEPEERPHGDIFFMVTKHPGQNVHYEPQFTVGYPFQADSLVTLDIDGKKFAMFTRGQNAWMKNPAEEPAVVEALRSGTNMKLSGKSRRGTATNYTYSLSGVTASLKAIESCK